jgi:hypothetical protein
MGTIDEGIIVSIVPWDYVFLSFSLMIPKLEAMKHSFTNANNIVGISHQSCDASNS